VLEVAENGVDRRHFRAVHGYTDVTEFEVTVDGPVLHSRFGFTKDGLAQRFDTLAYGLGYAITDLTIEKLGLHARVILLSNQVDAETVDFTVCAAVEGGFPALDRFLATIVDDVRKDLPIWAHKRRLARPSLVPGDGPIRGAEELSSASGSRGAGRTASSSSRRRAAPRPMASGDARSLRPALRRRAGSASSTTRSSTASPTS
jgi:hypothetical protein